MIADWVPRTPSADPESTMPVLCFLDRGGLTGNQLSGDPIGIPDIPGNKAGNARGSFFVGHSVFSEDPGSVGGISSSVADSNRRESLIDLKLGRLGDRDDKFVTIKNSEEKSGLSSVVSNIMPPPTKRTRSVNSSNQILLCQVHGCNMDLSSCKDYHKRHKVCEVHSKTAKVVVNGLDQRFCQQCSRFHLLAEFDEFKRSCRRRLAGHNERRRKHNLDTQSGKFHMLLPTHHDNKFPATPLLPKTPFVFPDIFSSGTLHEVKYRNNTGCRASTVEEEPVYNGELPKSSFPVHDMEKPLPGLQEIDSMGGSFFGESISQYVRTFTNHNPSFLDASSAIEELSRVRDSDCALYLLSTQSWDPPTQSSSLHMGQPLMGQCGPTHHNVGQFSEKILELTGSSQASTSVGSTMFSPSGINSVGDDQLGPVLVSDASDAIDFEDQTDGLFQNSDCVNAKSEMYQGGVHTVDLLQLSSQFQGAKSQMHLRQDKLENELFFWNPIS